MAMRLSAALALALAAAPAHAAFDGMRYTLDPDTGVLTGVNETCRVEIKEVRKFVGNGLFALFGNTFPYTVFFISADYDAQNRPRLSLYGLLGNTYLRDTKQPCRVLTTLIASDVIDIEELSKTGAGDPKFSVRYRVQFMPKAELSGDKLDAAIEAGTAALSRRLDEEAKR